MDQAGYDHVSAENGKEALHILEEDREISMVVSDWLMPEMDGFELLTFIRQNPALNKVPFLMLTGNDTREETVMALRFGANDYLTKPYHREELIARVKNLLKVWEFQQMECRNIWDEQTGHFNDLHCGFIMQKELARVTTFGGKFSLLLLVVDSFAQFKEDYGSLAGDLIIESLGPLISESLHEADSSCHLGNGQFIIMLPCRKKAEAAAIGEKLQVHINQEHALHFAGHELEVTCSVVAEEFIPAQETPEAFTFHIQETLAKLRHGD